MTVSVPRSPLCLALQNPEATACRERGRPVRPFIADTHRFKLAAFCLLPTAYFPLSAHRPLPTAHRSSRRSQDLLMQMRRRIPRDADVLDLFDVDSRRAQTVLDRLRGKAGAVLYTIEALLFSGGNKLTVFDHRRRRIPAICMESKDIHFLS